MITPLDPPLCLQYLNCNIYKVDFHFFTDLLIASCCRPKHKVFKLLCEGQCQTKFLTCEIADFTPTTHVQSDIPGHAFRKRWLFIEISNMLRTDRV